MLLIEKWKKKLIICLIGLVAFNFSINKVKANNFEYSWNYNYSNKISTIEYHEYLNQIIFKFDNSFNRENFIIPITENYFAIAWAGENFYVYQSESPLYYVVSGTSSYFDNSNYDISVSYVKNFSSGNILTQNNVVNTNDRYISLPGYLGNLQSWEQIYINHDLYGRRMSYNENNLYMIKNLSSHIINYNYVWDYEYKSSQFGINPMEFFDLYFGQNEFQKQIHYKIQVTDLNSFENCGYNCGGIEILGFDYAYMVQDNNDFFQWQVGNIPGFYIDHYSSSMPTFENGIWTLDGIINLQFDNSIYDNIKSIRISVKFSNALNYKVDLYFDENDDVHDYTTDIYTYNQYGKDKKHLNRTKFSHDSQYFSLFTNLSSLSDFLLVQPIETLKAEEAYYFNTSSRSYVESMYRHNDSFYIKDAFFDKFDYTIGTDNMLGVYLRSYLDTPNTYYWLYIADDTYFSYSNTSLNLSYIDYENNVSSGVSNPPNSQADDLSFKGSLQPFFHFVDELTATRIFMNNSFETIYFSLPYMVRMCLELACHCGCIYILLRMLGWGDDD